MEKKAKRNNVVDISTEMSRYYYLVNSIFEDKDLAEEIIKEAPYTKDRYNSLAAAMIGEIADAEEYGLHPRPRDSQLNAWFRDNAPEFYFKWSKGKGFMCDDDEFPNEEE